MTFQRTVAALAILKVNSDRGEDFIDSFVPFVVEALRRSKSDIVSLPEIQASIRDEFGINVPQGALSTMVGRVIRRGWATRADGLITRNLEAIGPSRIAPEREDFLAQYQRTVGSFMEYAANSLQRELLQDEASEALGAFLEAHAADVCVRRWGERRLQSSRFRAERKRSTWLLDSSCMPSTTIQLLSRCSRLL